MSENFQFSRAQDMLNELNAMRKIEVLTDVTLVTSGSEHEVKAHKAVLATSSPYFKAMFTSGKTIKIYLITTAPIR